MRHINFEGAEADTSHSETKTKTNVTSTTNITEIQTIVEETTVTAHSEAAEGDIETTISKGTVQYQNNVLDAERRDTSSETVEHQQIWLNSIRRAYNLQITSRTHRKFLEALDDIIAYIHTLTWSSYNIERN